MTDEHNTVAEYERLLDLQRRRRQINAEQTRARAARKRAEKEAARDGVTLINRNNNIYLNAHRVRLVRAQEAQQLLLDEHDRYVCNLEADRLLRGTTVELMWRR
jgi:hypothetical protein